MNQDLESLYQQAQSALKAKNYDQASAFLKQILLIDEDFRDASRLLALTVKLKRRRWYNDPRTWGTAGGIALLALIAWLASSLNWNTLIPSPIATQTRTQAPTATLRPTLTPTMMPTPVPLAWKRLYIGQEFPRDIINVIVFDPKDQNVIYVGTQNAGIYKSIDGGLSWQPAHNGLGGAWISSLVIDPQNPMTLYAGIALGGVYKTTDGGNNWYPANNGIDTNGFDWVSMVAISPTDGHQLYFSQGRSFYASSDGGDSWTELLSNGDQSSTCPRQITSLAIDPTNATHLLAFNIENPSEEMICQEGVYKSSDGGHSWSITLQVDPIYGLHYAMLTHDEAWKDIYASNKDGVYRSSDRGETWQQLIINCERIAVDPKNSLTAYCFRGGGTIRVTRDGGDEWTDLVKDFFFIPSITVSPYSSQTIFMGGNGLWITTDGGKSWTAFNNGLAAIRTGLSFDPLDPLALLLEDETCTVYRSADNGTEWELEVDRTCWDKTTLSPSGDWFYWIDKKDGGLRRSPDRGATSAKMNWPVENASPEALVSYPVDSNGLLAIYGFEYPFFYISYDYGETWRGSTLEEWSDWLSVGPSPRAFFNSSQGRRIYIASLGYVIFRSNDEGESWQICASTDTFHGTSERRPSMIVHPDNADRIILATRGLGVFLSTDGCQSWQTSNIGLSNLFVNTLAINPNNPNIVYAGTDGGAFISFDSGATWGQVNDGLLGATVVYSIVVDKDSNVYASTPYGIFKLEGK